MRCLPSIIAALLVVSIFAPKALAGSNDLRLARLNYFDQQYCGWNTPDKGGDAVLCVLKPNGQDMFGKLITELGIATAPKMLTTPDTSGQAGFEFGLATSFTTVNNGEPYWQVVESGSPSAALSTLQFQMVKGLPFGMEIGGNVTHLISSRMVNVSGFLGISLNEGIWYAPDITLKLFGGRLFGVGALNLNNAGADLIIGKEFSLKGVGTLTPYAGYEFLYLNANTKLFDPTPATLADGEANLISFNMTHSFVNKGVFGLRYLITIFSLYFQADISDKKVHSYSLKAALEF